MNAEKFFNEHSLEEISKKTKISPISLRFIKNKEYEKIPRVKFIGFIKLIEREFNIDLSELIEEYDQINKTPLKEESINEKKIPQKKENNQILHILIIALLIVSGIVLYNFSKKETKTAVSLNLTKEAQSSEVLSLKEENFTQQEVNASYEEINISKKIVKSEKKEENLTKEKIIKNITIIPNEKVWFRAIKLDTNKTYEFLTSKPRKLLGDNYYIKFGHGNVTIEYGDVNITPNTKKIVRILLKNGKYQYLKKGIR